MTINVYTRRMNVQKWYLEMFYVLPGVHYEKQKHTFTVKSEYLLTYLRMDAD